MSQFLKKPIIRDGLPSSSEGYEGEIRFGFHKGKLKQFVRIKNKWHAVSFGAPDAVTVTTTEETTLAGAAGATPSVTTGTFDSLVVTNLRVNDQFIGSDSTSISSATLAAHPNATSQAHPDYLKNTGQDELTGTLNITGRDSGGAPTAYTLQVTDTNLATPVLYTSNREFTGGVKKAGFWIASGDISGIFDVGTASNADFSISDTGVVSGYQLDFTSTVDAAGGFNVDGTPSINSSGVYIGGGAIVVDTISTDGGATNNEVYPLVTGSDADDGSIEYVGGSAQGNAAYKFKVGANSIKDAHLEYNTGQNLSTSDNVEFNAVGIGTNAGNGKLSIEASVPMVELKSTSGGGTTAFFYNSAGKITFGSVAGAQTTDNLPLGSVTFTSGFTGGSGWEVTNLGSDKYRLEIEDLMVRGAMNVHELLINQIRATNGSLIVSDAAKIAVQAQDGNNNFGIFTITSDDATDAHPFSDDDILLLEWKDFDGTDNKYYLIVTDDDVADANQFKATVYDNTGTDITGTWSFSLVNRTAVRIGSTGDAARRGGLYLSSVDSGAPFLDIWNDVDTIGDWTSNNKLKARLGNLEGISYAGVSIPANTYGLWAEDVYLKGKIHAEEGYIGDSTNGWAISSNEISNSNISIEAQNQIINIGTFTDFDTLTGSGVGIRMGSDGGGNFDFLVGTEVGNGSYLHYDGSEGTVTLRGDLIMSSGNSPVDWLGTWNPATTYSINDAVFRNSNSYVSIKDSPANTNKDPETETSYWDLLAAQGDTGGTGTSADIYKSFTVYRNEATVGATNGTPSNAAVNVDSNGDMNPAPNGWSLTPATPAAGDFTFFSTSTWKQTEGAGNFSIDEDWTYPSQLSGYTGATGADGGTGGTGDSGPFIYYAYNGSPPETQPSTPSFVGSYSSPNVSSAGGWNDDLGNVSTSAGDIIWVSQFLYEVGSTGGAGTAPIEFSASDGADGTDAIGINFPFDYTESGLTNLDGGEFTFGQGNTSWDVSNLANNSPGDNASFLINIKDKNGVDIRNYLESMPEGQVFQISKEGSNTFVRFEILDANPNYNSQYDGRLTFDSVDFIAGSGNLSVGNDCNVNTQYAEQGAQGATGGVGGDGDPGTSIALLFLYQRGSAAPVTTDLNTSEFNFSTNTISNIGNWSTTIPAADGNPCYVTTSPASTTDITVPDTSLTWEAPSILTQDGGDGLPGPKLVYAYKLMTSAAASGEDVPNDFSASYASPAAPTGWSLTIPTLVVDHNIYAAIATYNQDSAGATTITQPTEFAQWSGVQGTDGTSVNILGPSPSTATELEGYPNGPYSGDIGDAFIVQDTGDLWIWDGNSWGNAGNITGPPGPQGDPGTPGAEGEPGNVYSVYYLYKNSASIPADVNSNLVTINNEGVMTGVPQTWSSIPTSPGDGQLTYISQAVYVQENTVGNIGTNAYTLFGAWSTPAQFSGIEGLSASWTYEHDDIVYFDLGSAGDGQIGFKRDVLSNQNPYVTGTSYGEWITAWHANINQIIISRFDKSGYDHYNFFTTECAIGTVLAYTHGGTGETYRFKINSSYNLEQGAGGHNHGDIFSFLIEDVGDTYGEQGTSNVDGQFYPIASLDGETGTAGTDGETIVLVNAYRRSSVALVDGDRPTTQNYNFETGQLTDLDNSWTDTIPTTNGDPCYVVSGVARTTDITVADVDWDWSTPQIIFQDGGDGAPGLKTVYAYKNLTAAEYGAGPTVPTFSGTYATPTIDLSWAFSASAPSASQQIYVTSAEYTVDSSGTTNINPSGVIVQFSGQNGSDGVGVQIQGTVADEASLPSSNNTAGDAYIVELADNGDVGHLFVWDGDSWENSGQFVGPQGPPGSDGDDGNEYKTFTIYKNANTSAANGAGTPGAGATVNSSGVMNNTPTGWSLQATTPAIGEFTFYSVATWVNSNHDSPAWSEDTGWTQGALLSGHTGADGVQGGQAVWNVNNWGGEVAVTETQGVKVQVSIDKPNSKITLAVDADEAYCGTTVFSVWCWVKKLDDAVNVVSFDSSITAVNLYGGDGAGGHSANENNFNIYPVPFPEDGESFVSLSNTVSHAYIGTNGILLHSRNNLSVPNHGKEYVTLELDSTDFDDIANVPFELTVFVMANDYGDNGNEWAQIGTFASAPGSFIAMGDRKIAVEPDRDTRYTFYASDSLDFDVTLMNNSPVGTADAASTMMSFTNTTPTQDGFYFINQSDNPHFGYSTYDDNSGELTWRTYMDSTGKLELYGNPISGTDGAGLKWEPGDGITTNPSLQIRGDVHLGDAEEGIDIVNGIAIGTHNYSTPGGTGMNNKTMIAIGQTTYLDNYLYNTLDNLDPLTSQSTGLILFVLNKDLNVRHLELFDTYDVIHGLTRRENLADILTLQTSLQDGSNIVSTDLVIMLTGQELLVDASSDDSDSEGLVAAMRLYGATNPYAHTGLVASGDHIKTAYVLVGQYGLGEGNGHEQHNRYIEPNETSPNTNLPAAFVSFSFNKTHGVLFGGLTSYGTEISGNNISTGIIKSNNIDETVVDTNYITLGTRFDLNSGEIASKNFSIKSDGNAFFRGEIVLDSMTLSGSSSSIRFMENAMQIGNLGTYKCGISIDGTNKWEITENLSDEGTMIFKLGHSGTSKFAFEQTYDVGSSSNSNHSSSLAIAADTITLTSGQVLTDNDSIISAINVASSGVTISGDHIEINGSTVFTNVSNWEDPWHTKWSMATSGALNLSLSNSSLATVISEYYSATAGVVTPIFKADAQAQNGMALRFGKTWDGASQPYNALFDTSGSSAQNTAIGTNYAWRNQRVKIDPLILYKVSMRVKAYKVVDGGTATSDQNIRFGFMGYHYLNSAYANWDDSSGAIVASDSYPTWAGTGASGVNVDENWQIITYYMRGKTSVENDVADGICNDATLPGKFHDDVGYFGIAFRADGGADVNNPDDQPDFLVDWIKIETEEYGQTIIDGDMIQTGQISANHIDTTSIFANAATISDVLTLGTGAKIQTASKDSATNTTAGVYIDKDSFAVGTVNSTGETGSGIAYDGSNLFVNGVLRADKLANVTPQIQDWNGEYVPLMHQKEEFEFGINDNEWGWHTINDVRIGAKIDFRIKIDHPEQSWRICQMRLEIIPGSGGAVGHLEGDRFLRIWHTTGQAVWDYAYEHEVNLALSSTPYDLIRTNHGFGNATGSTDKESMWFFQATLGPLWDTDTTSKCYNFAEYLKTLPNNSIKWRIIHTTENYHPYSSTNNRYPDEPVMADGNTWHGTRAHTYDVVYDGSSDAGIYQTTDQRTMMTDQIYTAYADITVNNGG